MKTRVLFLVGWCAACSSTPPPGDFPMGNWSFNASAPVAEACELSEVTGPADGGIQPFAFNGVVTRESTSMRAWLTLAGYSREGTFDGQFFATEASASRVFGLCGECQTRLVETIEVAVLSRSQSDALVGACVFEGDGGVRVPLGGGAVPPSQTPMGFDAVRMCGRLTTRVENDGPTMPDAGACPARCAGCRVQFELRGERR